MKHPRMQPHKTQGRQPPPPAAKGAVKKPPTESKFAKLEKIRKSEWSGLDLDEFELTKMLELCPLSDGKTYELRPIYFRREDSMIIRNPRPLSDKTRLENLVAQNAEYTDVLKNLSIPLYLYDIHLVKNSFQMTVISINSRAEDFMDLIFLPAEDEEEGEDELPESSPLFPDFAAEQQQQPLPANSNSSNNNAFNFPVYPEPMMIFTTTVAPPQAAAQSSTMVEEITESLEGTTLGKPPKQHKSKKNKSDNID